MGDGNGGLKKLLGDATNSKYIPAVSGPLSGQTHPGPNFRYGLQVNAAAFPLSEDGKRVLCASISMVAGGPKDKLWAASPGEGFLLWQGAANANIAIARQVDASFIQGGIAPEQAIGLCAVAKAVYSFTTDVYTPGNAPTSQPETWVAITSKLPSSPVEVDVSCLTRYNVACPASLPNWLSPPATLAQGHDLTGDRLGMFCSQ